MLEFITRYFHRNPSAAVISDHPVSEVTTPPPCTVGRCLTKRMKQMVSDTAKRQIDCMQRMWNTEETGVQVELKAGPIGYDNEIAMVPQGVSPLYYATSSRVLHCLLRPKQFELLKQRFPTIHSIGKPQVENNRMHVTITYQNQMAIQYSFIF